MAYQRQNNRSNDGQRSYNRSNDGQRSYNRSNDGQRTYNRSNDGQRTYNKPGDGQRTYNKPGDGQRTYNRSNDGQRTYGKPGDGQRTYGKPGDGQRTYNKPGDGQRTYGKPGDGQRSYDKPGDGQHTYSKPGDGQRSYGKPGDGQRSYNRSNDSRRSYDRGDAPKPYSKQDAKEPYRRQAPPAAPAADVADTQQGGADELPYLIIGRNAVREAIKAGRSIDRILVTPEGDGSLKEIVGLARDQKLVIRETDRKKLDELCMPFGHGGKPANHQGIVAYAAGVSYCAVSDILDAAKARGEAPFVIVLDGVEDPHNLGSILRSAEQAGAHGVIIGKRRSAQVSAAAVKASAGAVEYIKVSRVVNISAALEELKKAGLWIAGADMAGDSMYNTKLQGPLALVIGGEGEGLSHLVKERCDLLTSIPMRGHLDSLNAGVAAAVLMFEKRRQDGWNA